MAINGMLTDARTIGADLTLFVAVPAILWGIIVAAWVVTLRRRTLGFFVAAVAFGGLGLFIGVYALIERRQAAVGIPHGEGCLECIGHAVGMMFGSLLLVVGTLLGLVALFLGRDEVDSAPGSIGRLIGGQPKSGDSVDSNGRGDQESDV